MQPRATAPGRRNLPVGILRWVLVALFAVLAVPKLLMLPTATDPFVEAGLPKLFVAGIGVLEAVGAIGLALPRTAWMANIGLILLTGGAVFFHFAVIGGSPISALVVLVLLAALLWLRNRPAARADDQSGASSTTNQGV
jgi:putative oxidoreductase